MPLRAAALAPTVTSTPEQSPSNVQPPLTRPSSPTSTTCRSGSGDRGRRRFHVMVKPVGAACNLDCTYCFYLSKDDAAGGLGSGRMSDERARAASSGNTSRA